MIGGGGSKISAVGAFRSLRLFRVFKLAKAWESLRHLLSAMAKTVYEICMYMVLLSIFLIIGALLGQEFFAYKIRVNSNGDAVDIQ